MLDLYAEELKLEHGMIQYGQDRYNKAIQKAEENSRGSETSYAQRLISVICSDLATAIESFILNTGPGKGAYARVVLRKLDPEQAAFITLKSIFDSLLREEHLLSMGLTIGQRIEDQIRFTEFEADVPDLYNYIVREFKDRNVVNYRRKHRVLSHAHTKVVPWKGLTPNQRTQLGVKLIELAIKSTGMFEVKTKRLPNGKTPKLLVATEDTLTWIEEHITECSLLYPDFAPTVLPPKPWTNMHDGGYYLQPLRRRYAFVKTKSKAQRKGILGHDYSQHMQAVNKIQETGWRINQHVLQTMQEVWRRNLRIGMPPSEPYIIPSCPYPKHVKKEDMDEDELTKFKFWKKECSDVYTQEKVRVSKCMLLGRVMSSAMKYTKYEEFYFVYNCDFRGRIYAASSGFSPQGPDISKGILEFSKGKPLGKTGFDWLCIHGANVYGFDKASYQDRVQWCLDRKEMLTRIGKDPFDSGCVDAWKEADKPYQFLAFCKEFSEAVDDRQGFVSHIPIAQDGSCNGLQHFSAMLRDSVGGGAVNLIQSPYDVPNDIYGDVANVAIGKLKDAVANGDDEDGHAAKSLKFGIDRKLTKSPVMIVPYGGTQRNCLNHTTAFLKEYPERCEWTEDIHKGGTYLGKVIWTSISDVVIAARDAMTWLRTVSKLVTKANFPLIWKSKSGFLVYQSMMVTEAKKIKTQLLGTVVLKLHVETATFNMNRQVNGISPNFVHSGDAAHACLTANATAAESLAMIHDSFGTHACDSDDLAYHIRNEFVKMYLDVNHLQELKEYIEGYTDLTLPDVPAMGTLDVRDVLKSKYFFS